MMVHTVTNLCYYDMHFILVQPVCSVWYTCIASSRGIVLAHWHSLTNLLPSQVCWYTQICADNLIKLWIRLSHLSHGCIEQRDGGGGWLLTNPTPHSTDKLMKLRLYLWSLSESDIASSLLETVLICIYYSMQQMLPSVKSDKYLIAQPWFYFGSQFNTKARVFRLKGLAVGLAINWKTWLVQPTSWCWLQVTQWWLPPCPFRVVVNQLNWNHRGLTKGGLHVHVHVSVHPHRLALCTVYGAYFGTCSIKLHLDMSMCPPPRHGTLLTFEK